MFPGSIPIWGGGLSIKQGEVSCALDKSALDSDFRQDDGSFIKINMGDTAIDYGITRPGWMTWKVETSADYLIRAMVRKVPPGDFTIFTRVSMVGRSVNGYSAGLITTMSIDPLDEEDQYTCGPLYWEGNLFSWRQVHTFDTVITNEFDSHLAYPHDIYLRMRYKDENLYFSRSPNGLVWTSESSIHISENVLKTVGVFAQSGYDTHVYNTPPQASFEFFRYAPAGSGVVLSFPEPRVTL